MARKPKPSSKPSFFKVLAHDFTRQLQLPPYFVRKHGKTLQKGCNLSTRSGQTFDVRIEKINDGKHCFFTGSGWSKFVKDLGLEIGETVIMWFDGKLDFDVSVFKTNGCEKETTFRRKPKPDKFSGDETEIGAKGKESWPKFEVVLIESSHKFRLTLPNGFASKAGLTGEKAVVLKYLLKKPHWAVLLEKKRNSSGPSFDLNTGWRKFRETNALIYGNTYTFTFNPVETLIQVESVRKK